MLVCGGLHQVHRAAVSRTLPVRAGVQGQHQQRDMTAARALREREELLAHDLLVADDAIQDGLVDDAVPLPSTRSHSTGIASLAGCAHVSMALTAAAE